MTELELVNDVRRHRERLGLSQQALAALVGVRRQAIVGIEGGHQVPSTVLGLRLARALRCDVGDLFHLRSADLPARLAPAGARAGTRVAVGEVAGTWVAHRLPADGTVTADGVVAAGSAGPMVTVQPLADRAVLGRNVLVTGCAPVLGLLAQRVGGRFGDARATWLPGTTQGALDLLEAGLVHVAGVHLPTAATGEIESLVRGRFPGQRMLIVNLARWREGLVVAAGNPLGIREGGDLLRPGLRFARREPGAGAHRVVEDLLMTAGAAGADLPGPEATGHVDVAQLVRCGAADVGVTIEGVALAAGLDFVPLTEERFDLVVPASIVGGTPVARLIEALDDQSFRVEMAHVPGYDTGLSGQVTTLEAA